ncbi:MAG: hypothetical protein ACJAU0_001568 [Flavobacteriales bacterium]|jgi:hypothetical protein
MPFLKHRAALICSHSIMIPWQQKVMELAPPPVALNCEATAGFDDGSCLSGGNAIAGNEPIHFSSA